MEPWLEHAACQLHAVDQVFFLHHEILTPTHSSILPLTLSSSLNSFCHDFNLQKQCGIIIFKLDDANLGIIHPHKNLLRLQLAIPSTKKNSPIGSRLNPTSQKPFLSICISTPAKKPTQLPEVDMQLGFVHKGNFPVNCRQLSEFFLQFHLKPPLLGQKFFPESEWEESFYWIFLACSRGGGGYATSQKYFTFFEWRTQHHSSWNQSGLQANFIQFGNFLCQNIGKSLSKPQASPPLNSTFYLKRKNRTKKKHIIYFQEEISFAMINLTKAAVLVTQLGRNNDFNNENSSTLWKFSPFDHSATHWHASPFLIKFSIKSVPFLFLFRRKTLQYLLSLILSLFSYYYSNMSLLYVNCNKSIKTHCKNDQERELNHEIRSLRLFVNAIFLLPIILLIGLTSLLYNSELGLEIIKSPSYWHSSNYPQFRRLITIPFFSHVTNHKCELIAYILYLQIMSTVDEIIRDHLNPWSPYLFKIPKVTAQYPIFHLKGTRHRTCG
ncbi:hypothetical protein VP01_1874g3 [Puccinia sorghi]|uniref:Uncharacterized protein n=1 Tax=Puccinia sorghi TaxID=27349 RepID=A0A0L6VD63_9BASI|nr:hypothetical protein VP01_1874g3 [Puccinia sorghi]